MVGIIIKIFVCVIVCAICYESLIQKISKNPSLLLSLILNIKLINALIVSITQRYHQLSCTIYKVLFFFISKIREFAEILWQAHHLLKFVVHCYLGTDKIISKDHTFWFFNLWKSLQFKGSSKLFAHVCNFVLNVLTLSQRWLESHWNVWK